MSKRERTATLPLVQRALILGWRADSFNKKATRHFYFYRGNGETIQVSWYVDDAVFSIGNTSTSSQSHALEMLEKLAKGENY